MLVKIECPQCGGKFGVSRKNIVNGNTVFIKFHCCYCDQEFNRNDVLDVIGSEGGVNIGGSAHIGGDVVGGDLHVTR